MRRFTGTRGRVAGELRRRALGSPPSSLVSVGQKPTPGYTRPRRSAPERRDRHLPGPTEDRFGASAAAWQLGPRRRDGTRARPHQPFRGARVDDPDREEGAAAVAEGRSALARALPARARADAGLCVAGCLGSRRTARRPSSGSGSSVEVACGVVLAPLWPPTIACPDLWAAALPARYDPAEALALDVEAQDVRLSGPDRVASPGFR